MDKEGSMSDNAYDSMTADRLCDLRGLFLIQYSLEISGRLAQEIIFARETLQCRAKDQAQQRKCR